jgi:hypothetical protein
VRFLVRAYLPLLFGRESLDVDAVTASQLEAEAAIDGLGLSMVDREDGTFRIGLAGPLSSNAIGSTHNSSFRIDVIESARDRLQSARQRIESELTSARNH